MPMQGSEDFVQHGFGHLRTALEGMAAVHQHLGLDDRHDAFVLADRRITGQRVGVGLDPQVAKDIANGVRPQTMKDDEAALYDLAMALYRDKKVSDEVYRAAQQKFGERGIMDIIGLIGYYDLVSMTLITMQAEAPNDSVPPLPPLAAK